MKTHETVLRLLRQRDMTLEKLANLTNVSRTHISAVMMNQPGRGGINRKKIAPVLTDEELAVLGWDRFGRLLNPSPSEPSAFLQSKLLTTEPQSAQRSTDISYA